MDDDQRYLAYVGFVLVILGFYIVNYTNVNYPLSNVANHNTVLTTRTKHSALIHRLPTDKQKPQVQTVRKTVIYDRVAFIRVLLFGVTAYIVVLCGIISSII